MAKLNDFMKNLGKGEILVPHLNKWFRQDFTGHENIPLSIQVDKPGDTAFHPSSDAIGCQRLIYAKFDPNVELEAKKFNSKVGINGHMWHGLIQHIVVELGFAQPEDIEARRGVVKYEGCALGQWVDSYEPDALLDSGPVDYELAWWATGLIDINNLTVPGYDEKFIVDIKTMNPASYKSPGIPKNFEAKYVAQMQLYLDWADLDTCILLAVEAGNPFSFREVHIKRDPDQVEYIYNKWNNVANALVSNIPPPHSCLNPEECASVGIYGNTEEETSPQTAIS